MSRWNYRHNNHQQVPADPTEVSTSGEELPNVTQQTHPTCPAATRRLDPTHTTTGDRNDPPNVCFPYSNDADVPQTQMIRVQLKSLTLENKMKPDLYNNRLSSPVL